MNPAHGEWWDFSWNPVTGCTHGCPDCWARERMAPRQKDFDFEPRFHQKRLEQPIRRKKGAIIFTVDMGDLFCAEVPFTWVASVMGIVASCPQHVFIVLTKNPARARDFFVGRVIPKNLVLGTSITGDGLWDRAGTDPVRELPGAHVGGMRMLSLEPFLGRVIPRASWNSLDWVVVGALTLGGGVTKQPDPVWLEEVWRWARSLGVPLWEKKNLVKNVHARGMPPMLAAIRRGPNGPQ